MEERYDTAVVGGGIAGFEAALALKNFRRKTLWLASDGFGEKLQRADTVRNFPSFTGSGTELSVRLEAQRAALGLERTAARVDGIYAVAGGFLLTAGERTFSAQTVILATGVETAGSVRGEKEFLGRGVSYCAVCDGALYKGKTVAAVLSSKKFEEEAEYLAGFAKKMYAFCLYPDPALSAENIEIVTGAPLAVEGEGRVQRIVTNTGARSVDGVFFLKNSAPPSALVGGLKTTADGHVMVERDMSTNLAGLFAAGDVTGRPYQYVKAAGEGLVAAYSVHKFLSVRKEIS